MRYISNDIIKDLSRKMVFIGGPRQVGKTTLAKSLMKEVFPSGMYYNWDYGEDKDAILKEKWMHDTDLIILDELHKYPDWKNWLKGIYDTSDNRHKFLVTGSARLDVYKKGSDSLMGRYHYWRLHPFGFDEIPKGMTPEEALKRFMTLGGFPEPFLDGSEREARRWRRERFDRIIREDIRDLESIRNIAHMDIFLDQLRRRVSSLVVLSNIANDIQVSPKTAFSWLEVLEKMYLVFSVRPYAVKLPRAVKKTPKVYFLMLS